MDKVARHKEICDLLNDIYQKKNAAYGDSFGRTFKELGPISAVTRMYDKMQRIISLFKGTGDNGESVKDTLLDLANYCCMTYMELDD